MRTAMLAVFGCSVSLFVGMTAVAGWGIEMWLASSFVPRSCCELEAVLLPVISVAFVFGQLGLLALAATPC